HSRDVGDPGAARTHGRVDGISELAPSPGCEIDAKQRGRFPDLPLHERGTAIPCKRDRVRAIVRDTRSKASHKSPPHIKHPEATGVADHQEIAPRDNWAYRGPRLRSVTS